MFWQGPGVGGPHGPYFQVRPEVRPSIMILTAMLQSERLDLYHEYAKKLLEVYTSLFLLSS